MYQNFLCQLFVERDGTLRTKGKVGHQGRSFGEVPLFWAEDLGIWLFYRMPDRVPRSRFTVPVDRTTSRPAMWNAFGTQYPTTRRSMSITVEINLSLDGTRHVGGALFEDDSSEAVWLGHSGKIAHLGKRFWDHYDGRTESVFNSQGQRPIQYAVIGKLGDASFFNDLARFIKRVAIIKKDSELSSEEAYQPRQDLCQRCGSKGTTTYFSGNVQIPEWSRWPLTLCATCVDAHDLYITNFYNMITEIHFCDGRHGLISQGHKKWGNAAEENLALLLVAKDNMDAARRLFSKECFEIIRPWVQDHLEILEDDE